MYTCIGFCREMKKTYVVYTCICFRLRKKNVRRIYMYLFSFKKNIYVVYTCICFRLYIYTHIVMCMCTTKKRSPLRSHFTHMDMFCRMFEHVGCVGRHNGRHRSADHRCMISLGSEACHTYTRLISPI